MGSISSISQFVVKSVIGSLTEFSLSVIRNCQSVARNFLGVLAGFSWSVDGFFLSVRCQKVRLLTYIFVVCTHNLFGSLQETYQNSCAIKCFSLFHKKYSVDR